MTDTHEIASGRLRATIRAQGGELIALSDANGPLLWHGGPEWPRHAPVLFPIVGRLTEDTLIHEGRSYHLTQHGFARDSLFQWIERTPDRAVLKLRESAETLARYPFRFVLQMIYEFAGDTLSVTTRVINPAETTLICGVGAHPAFLWPLAEGVAKEAHGLSFLQVEPGPGLGVEGGLLGPAIPLPFDGTELPLAEALFANDAIVIPDVANHSVRFAALDGSGRERRALTVSWEGYKDLGIWSKPTGAPFLCIEPWFSMASPIGWQGEFAEKPGILALAPSESRDFVWRATPHFIPTAPSG
ncbi:aldose 1-epimerase family protein [Bosea sp. F3-2]|uniref:aldose 1-epimerase family protein n=1 Tax=Bosea sp. F3-2 TaxID=2599640 RepID=UPI0011EE9BE5|nr:aldose 1-epimerase family protein [Bosea sp. F3-2]QEL24022.1 aldose 1-epimerase family protein [Bosea sp. F3-2]